MREIRFRAWDKKRNHFHWGISNVCLTLGGNLMWQFGYNAPTFLDAEESGQYILQQYTGLKDNNGKEIYEGDIIQTASEDILVVIWNKNFASFCLQKDGWLNDHYFGEAVEPMDCVVIGNIYENPELLEQMK